MFSGICSMCEKFNFCSKARKFIVTHGLKIESFIEFQTIGLREMHGDSIVDKALKLLDRFRKFKGYKYRFKNGSANIYLRSEDVKNRVDDFEFHVDTGYFEFDSNKKLGII